MHHFSPQGRARLAISSLSVCLLAPAFGAAPLIGNLTVTQNDTGNAHTGVTGVLSQSNGVSYVGGTRGDFGLRFDGATPAADVANGILMVSLRENGRSNQGTTPNPIGAGLGYATPAIQTPGNLGTPNPSYAGYSSAISIGNTAITTTNATTFFASGEEWNVNQSFAYFKYSDWLGGWADNAENNGAINGFLSKSAGFTVANGATDPGTATLFDDTDNAGFYTLRLGGFTASRGTNSAVSATSQNGILLVTGGKNEDNYALSSANADGTFTLICKDNGSDGFTFENDPVAFVYIPAGHSDVAAMGRIDAEGDAVANSGSFTVTKGGTGQWYLSAPGRNDSNSVLLISPEGATVTGTNRGDNLWSFAWDAANNRWVIEGRDIPGAATSTPGLQNMAPNEVGFSFALLAANPPPVVSLDSPAHGSNATIGAPVSLTATASDDTAVSKVQFYDGSTLLGEDTTAPYEFVWSGASLGTHSLTARAIDDQGGFASSTAATISVAPPEGADGLFFDGVDDYVTFGDHPALKLSTFTIECWFKREAGGVGAGTGSGGVNAIPLIAKGRGEADTPANINCNYFMGIDTATGKLAADFEDAATGLNHPALGQTVIPVGIWQHAAVAFDGTSWTLYLNGKEEATVSTEGEVPQNLSIQHAGLGTAMNSTGAREGYFQGQMDEVRIWNTARDLGQIQSTLNSQITSAPDLVARYAMDESSGSTLLSSAGTAIDGTLGNGVIRTTGATFDLNVPPSISPSSPANEAIDIPLTAELSAMVNDPNGGNLEVTFHGRSVGNASHSDDFTVVALPDTQFYSENVGGNRAAIFSAQTDWIVAEQDARNIGFVLHLGDITQNGDNPATAAAQWANASNAMYRLENPSTTGLVEGVPYIMAVGNHDQTPIGDADGTTTNFNTFFGVHPVTGINHFADMSYYGGTSEPAKADNNYTLFTAGGMEFIVISFEYDTTPDTADLNWADALLKAHPARRGIVITHHMVNTGLPASFSTQGSAIYQALKDNPNLILMHGGHIHGEGRRSDSFEGRTVHSLLADYQGRSNGGDGWLRIMTFRPSLNRIDVQSYSPTLNQYETDADSQFSIDVDLSGGVGPFTEIGSVTVTPGTASITWPGLEEGGRYEWYAEVSDGTTTMTTPVRSFTAEGAVFPPAVALTGPANGSHFAAPANITLEATASDLDGTVAKVEFFSGTTLLGEDTTAPYSLAWENVPAGSYTVIAKATDDEGVVASADAVSVQVLVEPVAPAVTTVSAGLFEPGWTVASTSSEPRGFENPGNNVGDIELVVNGSNVPFLSGVIAVANWNNAGESADNIVSAFANGSGHAVVSVADNSNNNAADFNPTTTEQSAGTAVAVLPFSGGFTGAIVAANGSVLASNLPAGAAVNKTGSGLYTVTGLSIAGNLLAFPNGNEGTTDGDNVISVRISNGTWVIDTRDNASGAQDISFSLVYLPVATPGMMSGMIRQNGSLETLNGKLGEAGGTVTVNANYYELTIGDGTVINPSTAALLMTADSTANGQSADNIVSYSASGNAFRVFTQDLPQLNGNFQAIDVRFVAVPFSLQQPVVTLPLVNIEATDATAGEYGADQSMAFSVTRTGSTTEALAVSYTTNGATSGSDFTALTGTVEIPAGQSSAIIPVTVLADDEAEGDESLVVTMSESAAYDLGTAFASATIADRPLQAFLKAHQLGAPEADDDGDGVANVLEYYLGTDGDDDASHATVTAVTAGNGSFTARFPHAKGASDVNAAVEWSTDLTNWHRSGESNGSQTSTVAIQPVSPAEEDPETLEAVLTVTDGPAPSSVYLRLTVTP
ncbi:Ig-like domain-containing protein [Luteolibacter arcticus]|uniref:Ig-like domain-containing protein n=1 Tax=Luteolibacter arcticus TaxID=1581411 RepID=A0ABT3GCY3_9BACT|nr:Ig-like domain-containing protein [Luteolibacter arcticus]MCW1921481.1 Ig-like domain-containing protein [Luteolibacter arcticus]